MKCLECKSVLPNDFIPSFLNLTFLFRFLRLVSSLYVRPCNFQLIWIRISVPMSPTPHRLPDTDQCTLFSHYGSGCPRVCRFHWVTSPLVKLLSKFEFGHAKCFSIAFQKHNLCFGGRPATHGATTAEGGWPMTSAGTAFSKMERVKKCAYHSRRHVVSLANVSNPSVLATSCQLAEI